MFTTDDLKTLFAAFAARMATERDHLCALDGAIGDGDHGIAMEQGMAAAAKAAAETEGTLQDICNAAAKGFLNAVGASSGPLYATGFLRAGKALGPVTSVPQAQVLSIIPAIRDGIAHRGKAVPGQKTMLDTWHPAAEAVIGGATAAEVLRTATEGAEATRAMTATLGRAERLGARAVGHPDPGAVSALMLIEEILARIVPPPAD
ncbi:dihydroxyacetone kinase DhaL subunit [Rubellimicrobium thermophilum DSM 16684]|uniref:Dihydroxyacetone kinase DhaL subunit n=1 Tax=Rubellimicrobium thermophilum DSM 16684 TaxID=1123069 RepID=S9SCC0_9RHOB|nr:dihydroxyacetone kinase subunit DhaL [Rubellimicrobium thermophilum]EPX87770.1 dihydroxyacetone kinase DhaL subunit [Rubellimicrobium thermophilum DSM 16684]